MVHSGNLDEFDEMNALFGGMGVRDWTVDIPSPAGVLPEHPELMVPPEVAGRYLAFGFEEACMAEERDTPAGCIWPRFWQTAISANVLFMPMPLSGRSAMDLLPPGQKSGRSRFPGLPAHQPAVRCWKNAGAVAGIGRNEFPERGRSAMRVLHLTFTSAFHMV